MNMRDPRWIGAWWLGFLLFGGCSILICIPVCCFPASLRKKSNEQATEYANCSVSITDKPKLKDKIKGNLDGERDYNQLDDNGKSMLMMALMMMMMMILV